MGVCFSPGQNIGRGDLDIFLQNSSGNPANAAEITYAIYFVDLTGGPPGVEVLIGPAQRTPVNPSVGEYYATLQVPPSASPGDYRIRWTFRELPGHPLQTVVQEFGVVDPSLALVGGGLGGVGGTGYSAAELSAIRSLRILLRDNCVGAEEIVELDVGGERMLVRMDDLWESCTSSHSTPIRHAYDTGALRVRSVSPQGGMEWKRVLDVHRADVGPESIWEAQTEAGPMVLTGGHRVFVSSTEKIEMEKLVPGQTTLGIDQEQVGSPTILGLKKIEGRQYMYDLTAEDWHNFVLHRSKVVISNSPDRNYKFRPPEQAGVVRQFNQVFGFVWEDYELIEYTVRAIAWFNMFPPSTGIRTIEQLVQQAPEWCTAVFMQAIVHATMALALNMIADEFSIRGDIPVTVILPGGTEVSIPIEMLHEVCHGEM